MKVVVVSVPAKRRPPPSYAKSLAKGIEKAGNSVDIIDAWTEDGRKLPIYEYVVIAAEQTSLFGGKMPDALHGFLSASSGISGKRSAAFLHKTCPFTGKGLSNLMRTMEKEGMLVNWSEVLLSEAQAEEIGKRIGR
jgi:menaquinone-dependent protoporphyrinogen IX oxidase